VSVQQFQHPDLVGDVAEALRVSGLAPSLLTLEITESLFVHDTEETTRKIGQLKDLGVAWRSTTSAPGTRRWATCGASPSTR
jgi:EAL domain-containing protein (putative c-di-GMP-specific phosphodiesterase class I)